MATTNTNALVVLKALEAEAKPLSKKISSLVIDTQADFDNAGKLLKQLKQYGKDAADKKAKILDPLKEVVKEVTSLFKPFESSIALIEVDTKAKMLAFSAKQQALAEKASQDFESGKIKKVSTLITKQKELEVTSSFASMRKVWTAIEVDATKTPREFLVPDMAKIKEALKAGKKVAGWKWEQVDSIAI